MNNTSARELVKFLKDKIEADEVEDYPIHGSGSSYVKFTIESENPNVTITIILAEIIAKLYNVQVTQVDSVIHISTTHLTFTLL